MIIYKQRDVVLVRFIFSEGTEYKKRPALVISSPSYHQSRQEIILAAITSNTDRILKGDTEIQEWKKASLLFPSLVTGVIQTVKGEMIERVLGSLSVKDFEKVQASLKLCFDLN